MALKVELKPKERLIVGDCVITNSDQRTRLYVSGRSPILREKDIMRVEDASSPAKRVYFAVQLMYLDDDVDKVQEEYFSLVNDLVKAAPSTTPIVDEINNEILTGSLYKALKKAKKLIEYERELIGDATTGGFGVPTNSQENS
ncbi:flagellar biosynthesis repressor FlbT [Maritalea myrionectae]|uniref:Putative flagellum biosynthesis repressor protein FlbT n=1 Tax=Maritalea myrionectae TaxID=454601 RepID=A0A2R4MDE2_9HYPH|nr:flagellar biosynthesis repressor FlbT [Maritalea myrionectae]AVX04058.1 putative flagellum biosynthesis repressor protein FlbT [Maritalea myrionectae]